LDNLEPEKTLGDWPMQYQIIRKTSLEDLQNSINDLINADWRPIGGLTIDGANAERYYLQLSCKTTKPMRDKANPHWRRPSKLSLW